MAGADRGGDADQPAAGVDKGTAARPVGDWSIGLDHAEEYDVGAGLNLTTQGGDDTDRQGRSAIEAKRASDGDSRHPDSERVGSAERQRLEICRLQLQYGHVGDGVAADDFGVIDPAVGEDDLDRGGPVDHVVVGDDVIGIEHDSRP